MSIPERTHGIIKLVRLCIPQFNTLPVYGYLYQEYLSAEEEDSKDH